MTSTPRRLLSFQLSQEVDNSVAARHGGIRTAKTSSGRAGSSRSLWAVAAPAATNLPPFLGGEVALSTWPLLPKRTNNLDTYTAPLEIIWYQMQVQWRLTDR